MGTAFLMGQQHIKSSDNSITIENLGRFNSKGANVGLNPGEGPYGPGWFDFGGNPSGHTPPPIEDVLDELINNQYRTYCEYTKGDGVYYLVHKLFGDFYESYKYESYTGYSIIRVS